MSEDNENGETGMSENEEFTMTQLGKVQISFNLKDFIDHYYGEDDSQMRDYLGKQAAALIVKDLKDDVRKAVSEQVQSQVADIVRETLEEGIRKTNTWGEPTGEPTSLRAEIVRQTEEFLTKPQTPRGGYREKAETQVQKFIREEVTKVVKSELQGALNEAKAQVTAAVKDQAAEVITQTVARMGGIR